MAVRTPQGSQKVWNRPKQTPPHPQHNITLSFFPAGLPQWPSTSQADPQFCRDGHCSCMCFNQARSQETSFLHQNNFLPVDPTSCWLCPPGCPGGPETQQILCKTKLASFNNPPPKLHFLLCPHPQWMAAATQLPRPEGWGLSCPPAPPLTTPLHSYPISYLILSVPSSPYLSNLLSVSSIHWELGLLPPNRYPALLSDFKLSSTFNHACIHSFNKYWGPSYKHLAKCLKCRMEKTELMPAHQELTVYSSREDDPKVIYMSTIYGYTYEYILYSMVINLHYLASYKY